MIGWDNRGLPNAGVLPPQIGDLLPIFDRVKLLRAEGEDESLPGSGSGPNVDEFDIVRKVQATTLEHLDKAFIGYEEGLELARGQAGRGFPSVASGLLNRHALQ